MLSDPAFFADHPDRRYRIREPIPGEFYPEFQSLGPHKKSRRRIIVYRLPRDMACAYGADLVPIPMILFADETVEDTDAVLGPVFKRIMEDARKRGGDRVKPRAERRRLA